MYMDLNLSSTKGLPYCPMRCCRKNTGPFEVSLIARASVVNTGESTASSIALPATSMARFITENSFLSPLVFANAPSFFSPERSCDETQFRLRQNDGGPRPAHR